jgi:PKD repeat protein
MLSLQMLPRAQLLFLTWLGVLVVVSGCQRVPLLAPSGSTITLTTSATVLPTNGTVTIVAQVLEPAGTPPHSGTHIIFTTTLGTIQPSEVETDINGAATVTFNAGASSGTATITASSGGATTGSTGALRIGIGAAAVGRIALSANPGTVAASGGTSLITASVLDTSGNVLGGVPVSFSTDGGSLSAAVATSDQTGNAQTTLTTNKTTKVTATAGFQSATSGTPPVTSTTPITQTITVNVNALSTIAVGTASPATPVVGQAVTFPITYTQNANGSPVARLIVDFGDGGSAQTFTGQPATVSHTYNQAGAFIVRVTAIDTFGDVVNGSGAVTVAARPQLIVGISASANPTVGVPTTFTITATPTAGSAITSVTVDLGDGTRRTLSGAVGSIQYAYSAAGTYVVTAIATDSSGATGSATTSVVVGGRSQLAVTISASGSPTVGTPVTFTIGATASAGAAISSIFVNFGDGSSVTLTGNATSVQHTYTAAGTYPVTATATDSSGATGSASTTVVVAPRATPNVGVTSTPNPSKVNDPVTFTATVSQLPAGVTIDHFEWDFGDGSAPRSTTSTTTSHIFTAVGNYSVSVTAVMSDGTRSSSTTEQRVNP